MLPTPPFVQPYEQSKLRLEKSTSLAHTNNFIRKVKYLIQLNFDNELFDASYLARQVHLSVSQLNRKVFNTLN
ncbi:hypothetical protein [Lewinella sp. LCG006]|uniref:hypothetical protein n=1 Tax=Lewinella sp. LCG006 TaxID=3231911 RepID=UPI00345FA21F